MARFPVPPLLALSGPALFESRSGEREEPTSTSWDSRALFPGERERGARKCA